MSLLEQLPTRMLGLGRCIFYKNIAACMLDYYGEGAQDNLRRAVHRLGERLGSLERQAQLKAGSLANLKSCFLLPRSYVMDSRVRMAWQLFNEQEAVFDVLCCPMRELMRSSVSGEATASLIIFCEEYHHGFIMGYTNGVGQCCLSEDHQFPLESSCHISCYFRPANMQGDERRLCFSAYEASEAEPPKHIASDVCAGEYYSRWAAMLISSIINENTELSDSIEHVLACGIRSAANETLEQLKKHAAVTRAKLNAGFAGANCLFFGKGSNACNGDAVAHKQIRLNYLPIITEALEHEQ